MPRRFRKGLNLGEIAAIGVVFIVAMRFFADFATYNPLADRFEKFREGPIEVVCVIDGETIRIRQSEYDNSRSSGPVSYEINLKLIGVDAPHADAADFITRFVSQGQARLRLDKRRRDHEGRLLGYIYVGDKLLNLELVSHGLAKTSPYPGDNQSISRRLRDASLASEEYIGRD